MAEELRKAASTVSISMGCRKALRQRTDACEALTRHMRSRHRRPWMSAEGVQRLRRGLLQTGEGLRRICLGCRSERATRDRPRGQLATGRSKTLDCKIRTRTAERAKESPRGNITPAPHYVPVMETLSAAGGTALSLAGMAV
jgi:hypothetical protein